MKTIQTLILSECHCTMEMEMVMCQEVVAVALRLTCQIIMDMLVALESMSRLTLLLSR